MKTKIRETITRVDIIAGRGAEELLSEDIYTVHSPSGLWFEDHETATTIKAYPENAGKYIEAIRRTGIDILDIRITEEDRRDYSDVARRYFRPIKVEDVIIRAPWNRQKDGICYITIEPGMAFGTGRHESTRLMLKFLRDVDIAGKKVLDVGCGSAILSLYARRKGAKFVYAVDNDQDAVLSARKNVLLNSATGIKIVCADIAEIGGRYDVVLANLDIRTFSLFSGHIMGLIKQGGVLIVSGIIGRERKKALNLFLPHEPVAMIKKNAWLGFMFKKTGNRVLG